MCVDYRGSLGTVDDLSGYNSPGKQLFANLQLKFFNIACADTCSRRPCKKGWSLTPTASETHLQSACDRECNPNSPDAGIDGTWRRYTC